MIHAALQGSTLAACGLSNVTQSPLLGDVTCPECLATLARPKVDLVNQIYWGHWSITLYVAMPQQRGVAHSFFGEIPFPVGPQGPMDGHINSPLRMGFENACETWKRGECPTGAMCYLDKKWMYTK